jgi:hypothetical protein
LIIYNNAPLMNSSRIRMTMKRMRTKILRDSPQPAAAPLRQKIMTMIIQTALRYTYENLPRWDTTRVI